MIVKSINKEEIIGIRALKNFYQNKHILLIGMGKRERRGKDNTVIDIQRAFKISKIYAWKLLGELKKDDLIEVSEKLKKHEQYYHNYKLTENAKNNLKILSAWLYTFNGSGESIDPEDTCYQQILCSNSDEELPTELDKETDYENNEIEEI